MINNPMYNSCLAAHQPIQDFPWPQQEQLQLQLQQQIQLRQQQEQEQQQQQQQEQEQQQEQQQEQHRQQLQQQIALEEFHNVNNYNTNMNGQGVTIDLNEYKEHELNRLKVCLQNERSGRILDAQNFIRRVERLEAMLEISATDGKKTKDLLHKQSQESFQHVRQVEALRDNALRHVAELQQQLHESKNQVHELQEREKLLNHQLQWMQQDQQELLQENRRLQQEVQSIRQGQGSPLKRPELFSPLQQAVEVHQIVNGKAISPATIVISDGEVADSHSSANDSNRKTVNEEKDCNYTGMNSQHNSLESDHRIRDKVQCNDCEQLKLQYRELHLAYNLCLMNEDCYKEQIEVLKTQQKKASSKE